MRHRISLSDAVESSEQCNAKGFLLEALVLKSVLYEKQNETTLALETLNNALAIAAPEGYIRIFINEGKANCRFAKPVSYLLFKREKQFYRLCN